MLSVFKMKRAGGQASLEFWVKKTKSSVDNSKSIDSATCMCVH